MPTKEWREANKDKVRAARRKWYAANKEKAKAAIKKREEELRAWFCDYKKTLECSRCDEKRWFVLDFHHKDPDEKDKNLANVIKNGWSKERILKEIDKCDVLCANCHRALHFFEK